MAELPDAPEGGSVITLPNGWKYHVPTDNPDEAVKIAKEAAQRDLNKQAQDEFANAPTWMKPFMAAQDLTRTGLDTLTFGGADKLADYMKGTAPDNPESQTNVTRAIRSRMGGADVVGDIGLSLTAMPTAVPKVVAGLGGGAIARGITGTLASTAEGAGTGAVSAAMHDQDPGAGAFWGGLAGGAGNTLANAFTGPVNKVANWLGGAKELPPAVAAKVRTAQSPAQRVESAVGQAELKGGGPNAYRTQMEKVVERGGLTPEQRTAVDRVMEGDPATKALQWAGNKLTNPLFVASYSAGLPLPASMAITTAGMGAKYAAKQGTREAADDLRRIMQNNPRPVGPLTDPAQLGVGLRERLRKYYEGD